MGYTTQELQVPINLRINNLQTIINELQSQLSNLKVGSKGFKDVENVLAHVRAEMDKLAVQTSKPFVNQRQFVTAERSIEKIEDGLSQAQITMSRIKFNDLALSPEQSSQIKQFNEEINNIKNNIKNVREITKQNFFGTEIGKSWLGIDPNAVNQNLQQITASIINAFSKQKKAVEDAETKFKEYEDALSLKNKINDFVNQLNSVSTVKSSSAIFQGIYNEIFNAQGKFQNGGQTVLAQWLSKEFELDEAQVSALIQGTATKVIASLKSGQLQELITSKLGSLQQSTSTNYGAQLKQELEEAHNLLATLTPIYDGVASSQLDTASATKQFEEALKTANTQLENYKQKQAESVGTGEAWRSSIERGKQTLQQFKEQLQQTETNFLALERTQRNFQSIKMLITNFMGFTQVLNLVKRGVRDALTHIKELDSVMNKISIVTNMTTGDLWKQIDAYSDMAQKYGTSIKGAYEVSQIYYQQGLSTNEVLTLTNQTLKAAKISGLDYAQTTDYMTTALHGFKMEASEASKVVDIYSNLAAHTAVSFEELSVAMSKTASSLESVGVSLEEGSAMIGTMVAVTRESATNIGSALKSIAARYGEMKKDPLALVDPDGDVMDYNKVDAALRSVGISLKDDAGQFRNMTDVILELSEVWDQLESTQQRYVATQFAGNRQQSRFLALVSNKDILKANLQYAEDSENVSDVQALKALDDVTTRIEQLKVAYQEMYTTIGLQDVWKNLIVGATNFMNTLNKLPKLFGTIPIGAIAMIADIVKVIKDLGFQALKGVSSVWAQLIPDKFGAEQGQQIGQEIANGIIEGLRNARTALQQAVQEAENNAVIGADKAQKDLNQPAGEQKTKQAPTVEAVATVSEEAVAKAQAMASAGTQYANATSTATENLDRAAEAQDKLAHNIISAAGAMEDAAASISATTNTTGGKFESWLNSSFSGIDFNTATTSSIQEYVKSLAEAPQEVKEEFNQLPSDLQASLVQGLVASKGAVGEAATELAETLLQSLRTTLNMHSPSPMIIAMFENGVGDAVALGLKASQATVESAAAKLGLSVSEELKEAFEHSDKINLSEHFEAGSARELAIAVTQSTLEAQQKKLANIDKQIKWGYGDAQMRAQRNIISDNYATNLDTLARMQNIHSENIPVEALYLAHNLKSKYLASINRWNGRIPSPSGAIKATNDQVYTGYGDTTAFLNSIYGDPTKGLSKIYRGDAATPVIMAKPGIELTYDEARAKLDRHEPIGYDYETNMLDFIRDATALTSMSQVFAQAKAITALPFGASPYGGGEGFRVSGTLDEDKMEAWEDKLTSTLSEYIQKAQFNGKDYDIRGVQNGADYSGKEAYTAAMFATANQMTKAGLYNIDSTTEQLLTSNILDIFKKGANIDLSSEVQSSGFQKFVDESLKYIQYAFDNPKHNYSEAKVIGDVTYKDITGFLTSSGIDKKALTDAFAEGLDPRRTFMYDSATTEGPLSRAAVAQYMIQNVPGIAYDQNGPLIQGEPGEILNLNSLREQLSAENLNIPPVKVDTMLDLTESVMNNDLGITLSNTFKAALSNIDLSSDEAIAQVTDLMRHMTEAFTQYIPELRNAGTETASQVVAGMALGLSSDLTAATTQAEGAGQAVISALNSGAGVSSPSIFAFSSGKFIMLGLTNGMMAGAEDALDQALKLGKNLIIQLDTGLNNESDQGIEKIKNRLRSRLAALTEVTDEEKAKISSAINNLTWDDYVKARRNPQQAGIDGNVTEEGIRYVTNHPILAGEMIQTTTPTLSTQPMIEQAQAAKTVIESTAAPTVQEHLDTTAVKSEAEIAKKEIEAIQQNYNLLSPEAIIAKGNAIRDITLNDRFGSLSMHTAPELQVRERTSSYELDAEKAREVLNIYLQIQELRKSTDATTAGSDTYNKLQELYQSIGTTDRLSDTGLLERINGLRKALGEVVPAAAETGTQAGQALSENIVTTVAETGTEAGQALSENITTAAETTFKAPNLTNTPFNIFDENGIVQSVESIINILDQLGNVTEEQKQKLLDLFNSGNHTEFINLYNQVTGATGTAQIGSINVLSQMAPTAMPLTDTPSTSALPMAVDTSAAVAQLSSLIDKLVEVGVLSEEVGVKMKASLEGASPDELANKMKELEASVHAVGDAGEQTGGKLSKINLGTLGSAIRMLANMTGLSNQAKGAITLLGGAITGLGVLISFIDKKSKQAATTNPWMGIAMAIMAVANGISLLVETNEEKLERLNKEAEELSNKAKEAKVNYRNLKSGADKLEELSEKRYESAEAAEEYQNAVENLTDSFPELISGFDAAGNAIIDAAAAEQKLTAARAATARAAIEAAQKEKEARAQQLKTQVEQKAATIDWTAAVTSMNQGGQTVWDNTTASTTEAKDTDYGAAIEILGIINEWDKDTVEFFTSGGTRGHYSPLYKEDGTNGPGYYVEDTQLDPQDLWNYILQGETGSYNLPTLDKTLFYALQQLYQGNYMYDSATGEYDITKLDIDPTKLSQNGQRFYNERVENPDLILDDYNIIMRMVDSSLRLQTYGTDYDSMYELVPGLAGRDTKRQWTGLGNMAFQAYQQGWKGSIPYDDEQRAYLNGSTQSRSWHSGVVAAVREKQGDDAANALERYLTGKDSQGNAYFGQSGVWNYNGYNTVEGAVSSLMMNVKKAMASGDTYNAEFFYKPLEALVSLLGPDFLKENDAFAEAWQDINVLIEFLRDSTALNQSDDVTIVSEAMNLLASSNSDDHKYDFAFNSPQLASMFYSNVLNSDYKKDILQASPGLAALTLSDKAEDLILRYSEFYDSLTGKMTDDGKELSAVIDEMMADTANYSDQDILDILNQYGVEINEVIKNDLEHRTDNTSQYYEDLLRDNITNKTTKYKGDKAAAINTLSNFLYGENGQNGIFDTREMTKAETSYFSNALRQSSNFIDKGYGDIANKYITYAIGIFEQLEGVDAEVRKNLYATISKNGINTREGIDKIITEAKKLGIDQNIIDSFTQMKELMTTNLSLSIQAVTEEFLSNWGDSSKTLKKLTSGIDFTDMQTILDEVASFGEVILSNGETFTLERSDFVENGDKLALTNEKALEYWEAFSTKMTAEANKWQTDLNEAMTELTGSDNGEFTEDMLSSLESNLNNEDTRRFLDTILPGGISEYVRANTVGDVTTYTLIESKRDEFIKALNEGYASTQSKIDTFNAYLDYAGKQIIKNTQWSQGDYSSVYNDYYKAFGENFDYMARLRELAQGAKYTDQELEHPDIKNAVDNMTKGYSSLLTDIMNKQLNQINVNSYSGIDRAYAKSLLNLKNIGVMDMDDLITSFAQLAGKTIDETNDLLVQQMEKSREQVSEDLIKDLTFVNTNKFRATYAQLGKLANAFDKPLSELIQAGALGFDAVTQEYIVDIENLKQAGVDLTKVDYFKETVQESIDSLFSNLADNISKALNGKLGVKGATDLRETLNALNLEDIELDFTKTADGLKLSTNSAIELYSRLKDVDALQAQLVFRELNDSLKETNEHYKSISDIQSRIAWIEDTDHPTRKKQYAEELALAKEILAVRSTSEDESFNFMSNKIPAAQNNPLNYFSNWQTGWQALESSRKSGFMDYTQFYNLFTEMGNLAEKSGGITIGAEKVLKNSEDAAKLIEDAASCLKVNSTTGQLEISLNDLSKLGYDFSAAGTNMDAGVTKGIKDFAHAQVTMLDGMIRLLEVIVQMENLGDITGGDNKIDFSDLYPDFENTGVKQLNGEAKEWIDQLFEAAKTNEDLELALTQIQVNGESLKTLLKQMQTGEISVDNAKAMSDVLNSMYQMYLSGDWDLDNLYESLAEIAEQSGLGGELTLNIDDTTLIISGGKITQIDWRDADTKEVLEEWKKLGVDHTQESLVEAINNYMQNKPIKLDELVLVLKQQKKIQLKNGHTIVNINGKDTDLGENVNEEKIAQWISLQDAGFEIPDNIDDLNDKDVDSVKVISYQGSEIQYRGYYKDGQILYRMHGLRGEYKSFDAMALAWYNKNHSDNKVKNLSDSPEAQQTINWAFGKEVKTSISVTAGDTAVDLKNPSEIRESVKQALLDDSWKDQVQFNEKGELDFNLGQAHIVLSGTEFKNEDGSGNTEAVEKYIRESVLGLDTGLEETITDAITKSIPSLIEGLNSLDAEGPAEVAEQLSKMLETLRNLETIDYVKIAKGLSSFRLNGKFGLELPSNKNNSTKIDVANLEAFNSALSTAATNVGTNAIAALTSAGFVNLLGLKAFEAQQHVAKFGELAGGAEHQVQGVGIASVISAGLITVLGGSATLAAGLVAAMGGAATLAAGLISGLGSAASAAAAALSNIEVNVSVNVSGGSPGSENNEPDISIPASDGGARGTIGLANAKGTLMGELGPELVVSNGSYFVVGQNGPEMVNLADDAIVFNHLQTKSLLEKGTSPGRGKAITNERTATAYATGSVHGGPAKASAQSALNALKQLRAQWKALESMSVKDLADKAGSGGGGSGQFIKDLEKWYNWLQKIAQLEKDINYYEAQRNRINSEFAPSGEEYYKSQKKSLGALKEELATQVDLTKSQAEYFESRRAEMNAKNNPFTALYTFDEAGQLKYKDGALKKLSAISSRDPNTGKPYKSDEEQYKAILALNSDFEKFMKYDSSGQAIEQDDYGAMVQAFWDKIDSDKEEMQSLHDSVEEGYTKVENLQQSYNEILKDMRDNQLELEQKVYDAVVDIRQRAIDELTDTKEAIQDSNDKYITGLKNALDKERQMYESQNAQRDLDKLIAKRNILMRSGGSAGEISSLNSQIEDQERSLYFDKQQEQIDAIEAASDKQIEKLEAQINIQTELLEYQKKYGLLWSEVTEIMTKNPEEIANFIYENDQQFWGNSPLKSEEEMNQLRFSAEKWTSYRDDGGLEEDIKSIAEALAPKNETQTDDGTKSSTDETKSSTDESTEGTKDGKDDLTQGGKNTDHGGVDHYEYNPINATDHKKIPVYKDGWTGTGSNEAHFFISPGSGNRQVCKLCGYYIDRDVRLQAYDRGGIIPEDQTALVHANESVLTPEQTSTLRNDILGSNKNSLMNLLLDFRAAYTGLEGSTYSSISNNSNPMIIEKAEVNLNIDKLANDYDSKRAANTIMDEMLRIASKTKANNSVRR